MFVFGIKTKIAITVFANKNIFKKPQKTKRYINAFIILVMVFLASLTNKTFQCIRNVPLE